MATPAFLLIFGLILIWVVATGKARRVGEAMLS